jgi:hypothetical protein
MKKMNEQDLRDCFAMFAMNGIIARGGLHPELMPEEAMARRAYEVADAMLEARSGKDSIGLPPVRARKTKNK